MSVYVPPAFGSFGKSAGIFQIYDKDTLDNQVRVVQKSVGKEKVAVDASLVYPPKAAQPRGVVKASAAPAVLRGAVVDLSVQTDVKKASSIGVRARNVFPKALPGLNVAVTETTSEKDFDGAKYGLYTTVSADYARSNFTTSGSVTTDYDRNLSLSAAASVGFDGFSVGGDVKVLKSGDGALAPKSYNAGVSYTRGVYTAALTSDDKFNKLKGTLLTSRVPNMPAFTQLGLQAKVDLQAPKAGAPQREFILGGNYNATPSTTYKGALVLASNWSGVFAVEHRLRDPQLAITATSQFTRPSSAFAPWPVPRFGVGLTFGEY